jgi:hypothetical protein
MKPIKYLTAPIILAISFWIIPTRCFAQDPGLPDSLIIDTVSVPFDSINYSTRHIPVYFVTDDSVCWIYISLKITSPDSMIFFGRSVWRTPFTQWDDVYDTMINPYTMRTVLFCDIGGDPNPPLFTDRQRLWGIDLRVVTAPQAQPQFTWIDSMGSIEFGGFHPQFQRGYIRYGGVSEIGNEMTTPTSFELLQNYPNPFNSQTVISFELQEPIHTNVEIFDITGAKIATLIDDDLSAGKHSLIWDAGEYSSGLYFYRLTADENRQIKKMLLIK